MPKILFATVIIGLLVGFFISLYSGVTALLEHFFYFKNIPELPWWYIYLIPTASIFTVNFLISKHPNVKEYGVAEIAKAVEENKMVFTFKDLFLKIIASALSISSGFAVGNEGPSAAIGAMISYKIHTFFRLPKNILKLFLSIGASSGIAAIFVSPVTGIMFALENIAYEFVKNSVSYLILGSVLAFSISYLFLEPIIFNYSLGRFIEYKYIFASLFFIPFVTFFIYVYLFLKDTLLNFLNSSIPQKFQNILFSLIGGISIGTIILISPYGAFSGHEIVNVLINNNLHLSLAFILAVIFLRIIATAISIYANAVGGVFIALMSIGALIGYGYGEMLLGYGIQIEPFYYAAIGAAVFMGVNMKLPLTAIVLALEITYDYNVVIPTGIIVVLSSYLVSLKFNIKKLKIKKDTN